MANTNKSLLQSWARILIFIGLLYIFLVSIGLMGAAFKLLGKDAAAALISATSNPFTGLLIGILSTALVQSSSATTSTVVGLVSGGALTIGNAVPIIMGANIGTSVTNIIVSMGYIRRGNEFKRALSGATVHDFFNLLTVFVLFPVEIFTGLISKIGVGLAHLFSSENSLAFHSPLKMIIKPTVKMIESATLNLTGQDHKVAGILVVVLSFVLLFFALIMIVKNMRALMVDRLEKAIDRVFGQNPVFAVLTGLILTAIVQSSSITTSLLVPLVGAGAMSLEAAFPITVGANIGTTVTALLASLAGNVSGLAIAFTHLTFNVFGMLLFYVNKPFRKIPLRMAVAMGEIAARDRRWAFVFLFGVFYIIPLIGFGISKALGF